MMSNRAPLAFVFGNVLSFPTLFLHIDSYFGPNSFSEKGKYSWIKSHESQELAVNAWSFSNSFVSQCVRLQGTWQEIIRAKTQLVPKTSITTLGDYLKLASRTAYSQAHQPGGKKARELNRAWLANLLKAHQIFLTFAPTRQSRFPSLPILQLSYFLNLSAKFQGCCFGRRQKWILD